MTDSQSQSKTSRRNAPRNRRGDLLKAARRLFLAEGYRRTSVSAIVRAAGVAQGTFYLYFKSKEQVMAVLRVEVLEDYVASFVDGLGGAGLTDERLVAGVTMVFEAVCRQRALVRVIRQAATGEQTERVWIEGRETMARPLATLLEQGVKDGSFHIDDPLMSAHLVMTVLDDLLYEAVEYGRPADGPTTLVHACRFVLRGLGAAPGRIDEIVSLAEVNGS